MASDFFMFDNTSSFYSDPFSPFTDSTSIDSSHHEILQSFQECINGSTIQENGVLINNNNNNSLDQISCGILSSSPPSHQFENLSLTQIPTPQNFINPTNSLDVSTLGGVKLEEFQINFASENGDFNGSFCGNVDDRAMRVMQRSYSSNLVDEKQRTFCFQPRFDCVLEPQNFQPQVVCISPERNFSSYQIRRVSSTGDLQRMRTTETRNVISSSPLSTEASFLEEPNFKVGRYSAEERKERIHRYRAKRNQRNFNKTIKYACRKTLADNRPRIRGRFARNDEAVDTPKTAMFNRYEEEDDLWVNRYHDEEEEDGSMGRGPLCNSYGSAGTLYQYYSY